MVVHVLCEEITSMPETRRKSYLYNIYKDLLQSFNEIFCYIQSHFQAMSGKKRYLCDESHTLNVLHVRSSAIIFLIFFIVNKYCHGLM